jgi:hypothetical protein
MIGPVWLPARHRWIAILLTAGQVIGVIHEKAARNGLPAS